MSHKHIERNITLLQAWLNNLKEKKEADKNAHYNMGDFQIIIIDHVIAINHEIKQLIIEYEDAMQGYFDGYVAHLKDLHHYTPRTPKKETQKNAGKLTEEEILEIENKNLGNT